MKYLLIAKKHYGWDYEVKEFDTPGELGENLLKMDENDRKEVIVAQRIAVTMQTKVGEWQPPVGNLVAEALTPAA